VNVADVLRKEHQRITAERQAVDELGLGDDVVRQAEFVERLRFVRDVYAAYRDELARQWKLPRSELKAALHEAMAAVERDDLEGLSSAVIRVADVLGGER
jgi:hypothetical protein